MTSKKELSARLEAAERQLGELTAQAARNEDKMRRSLQRELRLLQAETLDVLITELTDGLRVSYGVEYVSVVLCDADHDVRHLLLANSTPAEDFPALVMVESMSGLAPQYIALRAPWLGPYAACDHQLICPGALDARSIAMIPLMHRGKLLGSINICSSDPSRFTRDELRAAVERPALKQGAIFETGLVDRILDDVGEEPGNLPLLEYALTLLCEEQSFG